MATADLITELNTDLNSAYTAISGKGGTVPENKNSNNLAAAINSITGGEGGGDGYDIPEFDGGEYGAIAYIKDNEVKYYTATSATDLALGYGGASSAIKTLADGTRIYRSSVLAFSFGTSTQMPNDNFLANCYNLRFLYGTDKMTAVTDNFLHNCHSFNQPLTIPSGVTQIGNDFMSSCILFNSPLTLPETLTSIGMNFMFTCSSFNQPLVLPNSLTSIDISFMNECRSYAQPLTIPGSVSSVYDFMQNIYAFTGPLTVTTTTPLNPQSTSTLMASSETAPAVVTGVTLMGSGAQAWKNALADNYKRKLIVA